MSDELIDEKARDLELLLEFRMIKIIAHLAGVVLPDEPMYRNIAEFTNVMHERRQARYRFHCLSLIAKKLGSNAE